MLHRLILLLIVVLISTGCGDDPSESEVEVSGRYRSGFETSELILCESGEEWWVADSDGLAADYDSIVEEPANGLYVSVVGVVSEIGEWGHMGCYSRELRITSVREARAWLDEDCTR